MFKNINPLLNYLSSKALGINTIHDGEVCIGFSSKNHINKFAAFYLKLIFETLGITVQFSEPSDENFYFTKNISLYCAIIPSDFGTIRSNDYKIGEQTLSIIKKYPNCKVLFVYCQDNDNCRVENLINSIEEETSSKIELFDFSDLLQTLFSTSHFIRRKFMAIDARDSINLIMTKELMTVDENDRFSDLYFMMTTLGVRHCPVFRTGTKECVRMISKRDLVQQIPPANLISNEEAVKIGLEMAKINHALREIAKKPVRDVFPLNQQLLKVPNTESIEKVISLLAFRQPIGGGHHYISGVPVVLAKEKELVGFVSYTDTLKFIRDNQVVFLQERRVEDVATLIRLPSDVDKISYLTLEDDLATAMLQLQAFRSLPVVGGEDERNWVGFVDDLKVKMFSHKLFMNELKGLSVKHFMIAADKLPIITAKQTLAEIIKHFLEDANGMRPPSTFVVTEKVSKADGSEYQRVQGVISYTDILKNWLEWRKPQQNMSNTQDSKQPV